MLGCILAPLPFLDAPEPVLEKFVDNPHSDNTEGLINKFAEALAQQNQQGGSIEFEDMPVKKWSALSTVRMRRAFSPVRMRRSDEISFSPVRMRKASSSPVRMRKSSFSPVRMRRAKSYSLPLYRNFLRKFSKLKRFSSSSAMNNYRHILRSYVKNMKNADDEDYSSSSEDDLE